MAKPRIYLASPLGFSEAGRLFYHRKLVPLVRKCGFRILDPWQVSSRSNRGRKNAQAIRTADLILAVLDGADIDSGTAAEIGYAVALGKPVIGYRSDSRRSWEDEANIVNLQVEYFIGESCGRIVRNLRALERVLKSFLGSRN